MERRSTSLSGLEALGEPGGRGILRLGAQSGFDALADQLEGRFTLQDQVIVELFEAALLERDGYGERVVQGLCRRGAGLEVLQTAVELAQPVGIFGQKGPRLVLFLE